MFFFFQAEDGIRDVAVTGVQTCALPIFFEHGLELTAPLTDRNHVSDHRRKSAAPLERLGNALTFEIGRASCRESVDLGGRRSIKKKKRQNTLIQKEVLY